MTGFLGHDLLTHRNYYRLPEDTVQIAKVSKVLLAMEQGQISKFAGKTLDAINFDDSSSEQTTNDGQSEDEPADEGGTGSVGECDSQSQEVVEDITLDDNVENHEVKPMNVTSKLNTAIKIDDCTRLTY